MPAKVMRPSISRPLASSLDDTARRVLLSQPCNLLKISLNGDSSPISTS